MANIIKFPTATEQNIKNYDTCIHAIISELKDKYNISKDMEYMLADKLSALFREEQHAFMFTLEIPKTVLKHDADSIQSSFKKTLDEFQKSSLAHYHSSIKIRIKSIIDSCLPSAHI